MDDVSISLDFQNSIDQTLRETYLDIYESLKDSENLSFVVKSPGMKETLERAIEHFSLMEEYEKCSFIKKLMEKYLF